MKCDWCRPADISYVRQMESWMITTRPRRREPLWAVTDETMRNWLKQAVRRAEADGNLHCSSHTPSGTAICTYTSPPARKVTFRRWPVTRIARWRCIRGCSRWTWPPHWLCRSPVTGMIPRRSCGHSPSDVTTSLHHSLYKLW